jgi:phosphoribosyl 1,2-cyclic phosphodiesterase
VRSFASGSKANCTFVSDGSTNILIDLGVSMRYLTKSLSEIGLTPSDIDAVFITHEHCDHVTGLSSFLKKLSVPVHMTEMSYLSYIRGSGFDFRDKITVHSELNYTETVGTLTVSSMPVPHDSAACVAYKISGDGVSLGICTDIGAPNDSLLDFFTDCRDVITEANHDEVMLKCGIYPDALKRRILSDIGHTSNKNCADFVVKLVKRGVKNILLSHISPENNTPELAVYCVNLALSENSLSVDFLGAAPRMAPFDFPPKR